MSNETKFSKGKWQGLHVGAAVIVACDDAVAKLYGKNMDANASLFAAAADMYANEEKNLAILKTILKCYENVEQLMKIDKDVQTAINNEAVQQLSPT